MLEIRVQNLSVDELNKIISDAVQAAVKHLIPKPESKVKYLSRKETASLLEVSLVTLNSWTKKGILKAHKIGTRVRYRSDEVEKALKEVETIKFQRK